MIAYPLPRKHPATRPNAAEVAEVAAVTPGARRGEVSNPLLTPPRRTYLHTHTKWERRDQPAQVPRYLRYPRYPRCECPGRTVNRRVALPRLSAATQPLPQRDKRS